MSAEVKRVTIQIGTREIELSVEEAKELKIALEGIFPPPQITFVPQPYPVPYEQPWYRRYPYWEVTCASDGTSKYESRVVDLSVSTS